VKKLLLLAAFAAAGCATTSTSTPVEGPRDEPADDLPPEASATEVLYRGRVIDVGPHVASYPYRSFRPIPELNVLLYMHEGEQRTLRAVPLDGSQALAAGAAVSDVDWNTRNIDGFEPVVERNAVLFAGDEDNAEAYDLYELSLTDHSIRKLTDVPYVYGWGVDHARSRIGYVARYPIEGTETYRSCFETIPYAGGEPTQVVCDTPELPFTWTGVHWSRDDRFVFLRTKADNDRMRQNLVRVDLTADAPALERLTPEGKRSVAGTTEHLLDDEHFVYVTDESGFLNAWRGRIDTGELLGALTERTEAFNHIEVLKTDDTPWLLGVIRRPTESEIVLMDANGAVQSTQIIGANLYPLEDSGSHSWFYATSRQRKLEILRLELDGEGGFVVRSFLKLPPSLAGKLEQCDVEAVQIPTFDTDPATGEPRLLHAYYSKPKIAPDGPKMAAITAFYGGGNYWDTRSQILCEAGISSLSPAVRGSSGFGREFFALNDGDLGGDEIVDLHHAAQWLVERGYEPANIGAVGGSHGGYATMRALTFPPETNGRNSAFDWGWGVSFFGFSDIKTFWEDCNIPDWVLLEAGDPATEPEKIRDRSPLHHVDKLTAPLLLLHGENDQRVPVRESRQFFEACQAAGKPCVYEEFAGQGHGLKGLANQVRVYRTWLAFLEEHRAP